MERRRVVVTGMGLVSPLGCELNKFWERLVNGHSGIRAMSRFDCSKFTSRIAGEVVDFNIDEFVSKKEQRRMDPFCHYGIAAAKLAVKDSGLDFTAGNNERVGVLVGSGVGGLQVLQEQMEVFIAKGPSRFSPFMIPQMISNIISGYIAIDHHLNGPNFGVVSA